ncbi:hypothetical protein B296_00037400 [Ensete ventricosum]|uniref:Uncharacterized protein n=1 Tax=Ensete ventricosum TaxID=4639 RepID=A0A426YPZ3_ENSVE|nr:hypothetical protein B296_00037400 [Ensete ventricosum]
MHKKPKPIKNQSDPYPTCTNKKKSRRHAESEGGRNLREGSAHGPDAAVVAEDGGGGEMLAVNLAHQVVVDISLPRHPLFLDLLPQEHTWLARLFRSSVVSLLWLLNERKESWIWVVSTARRIFLGERDEAYRDRFPERTEDCGFTEHRPRCWVEICVFASGGSNADVSAYNDRLSSAIVYNSTSIPAYSGFKTAAISGAIVAVPTK